MIEVQIIKTICLKLYLGFAIFNIYLKLLISCSITYIIVY